MAAPGEAKGLLTLLYDRNVSNGLISYISDASEITPPDFPTVNGLHLCIRVS